MKFFDKKSKLDYLLELIKKECTGNANDLRKRLYVSKRTLLRYISDLRLMGDRISFCMQRNTYYMIKENEKEKIA